MLEKKRQTLEQIGRLDTSIEQRREILNNVQSQLDFLFGATTGLVDGQTAIKIDWTKLRTC